MLARAPAQPDIDPVMLDEAPLELRRRWSARVACWRNPIPPRRVRVEVETLSQWFDVRDAVRAQDRAYVSQVAREGLG